MANNTRMEHRNLSMKM